MGTELLRFLAYSLAGLIVFSGPAALVGSDEWARLLVAFAICVPLSMISLWLGIRTIDKGPLWQMGVILGGTVVRMFAVLALAGAAFFLVPICQTAGFFLWVAAAYLYCLFVEVWRLLHEMKLAAARNVPNRVAVA